MRRVASPQRVRKTSGSTRHQSTLVASDEASFGGSLLDGVPVLAEE